MGIGTITTCPESLAILASLISAETLASSAITLYIIKIEDGGNDRIANRYLKKSNMPERYRNNRRNLKNRNCMNCLEFPDPGYV